MEKLTEAILANKPAAMGITADISANKSVKAAAWAEKKRTAMICPHCNPKHPNHTHDQCWELPANTAKHLADRKSVKSTGQYEGPS